MAITALHAAASGMKAQDTKLDVVANNLANINTVGFKRSRVNFEDLLYQVRREPGTPNADDEPVPALDKGERADRHVRAGNPRPIRPSRAGLV